VTASRIRWVVIFLLYAVFHVWYGGNGSPLSADEVEHYAARARELGGPDTEERFRKFASNDDGREFVMVNLNKYRERTQYRDGREVDQSPREVERLYLADVLPKLLVRACHPVIVVDPILTIAGEGDLERTDWERIALARYRSRRDFLEIMLESNWEAGGVHKWAALERTHTMPTVPRLWGVGIRVVPFLLLLCVGLLLDRIFGAGASRRPSQPSAGLSR